LIKLYHTLKKSSRILIKILKNEKKHDIITRCKYIYMKFTKEIMHGKSNPENPARLYGIAPRRPDSF
jgi:hypothetical protein